MSEVLTILPDNHIQFKQKLTVQLNSLEKSDSAEWDIFWDIKLEILIFKMNFTICNWKAGRCSLWYSAVTNPFMFLNGQILQKETSPSERLKCF